MLAAIAILLYIKTSIERNFDGVMNRMKSAFEKAMERVEQLDEPGEEQRLFWKLAPLGQQLAVAYLQLLVVGDEVHSDARRKPDVGVEEGHVVNELVVEYSRRIPMHAPCNFISAHLAVDVQDPPTCARSLDAATYREHRLSYLRLSRDNR